MAKPTIKQLQAEIQELRQQAQQRDQELHQVVAHNLKLQQQVEQQGKQIQEQGQLINELQEQVAEANDDSEDEDDESEEEEVEVDPLVMGYGMRNDCYDGDTDAIISHLDAGKSVNCVDENGNTPISLTLQFGHLASSMALFCEIINFGELVRHF
jgi:hypothetical protein